MTVTTPTTNSYDPFDGPGLDPSRWAYLEYPLPDGTSWVCTEPSVQISTADGRLGVEIDHFERAHPVQVIDNCKFVVLSIEVFEIPTTGSITISAELAATSINGSGDYRDGFASLIAIEPATGLVFDIATTGDEVLAIHEQLPISETVRSFTRIVDDPLAGVATGAGVTHLCSMTINAADRTVRWNVDGHNIFDADNVDVPRQIKAGMGIFTLHPVTPEGSRSLRGQGLHASWSKIAVEVQA